MASRSTALPSSLPSSAVPWILTRSTVAGLAPGTSGGTSVCTCGHHHFSGCTCAASGVARATHVTNAARYRVLVLMWLMLSAWAGRSRLNGDHSFRHHISLSFLSLMIATAQNCCARYAKSLRSCSIRDRRVSSCLPFEAPATALINQPVAMLIHKR